MKSTIQLTREEAEQKFAELGKVRVQEMVRECLSGISNDQLARILADLNDAANQGEGFENYWILG